MFATHSSNVRVRACLRRSTAVRASDIGPCCEWTARGLLVHRVVVPCKHISPHTYTRTHIHTRIHTHIHIRSLYLPTTTIAANMAGAYSSRLNLKPQPVAKAHLSDSVARSAGTGPTPGVKRLPNKPRRLRRTLSTTAAARRERGVAESLNKSLMEG